MTGNENGRPGEGTANLDHESGIEKGVGVNVGPSSDFNARCERLAEQARAKGGFIHDPRFIEALFHSGTQQPLEPENE